MTLNMTNIANLLDEKLEEKLSSFKSQLMKDIIEEMKKELKTEITNEFKLMLNDQTKKIDELESTIEILRSHVDALQVQNTQPKLEELEQYGRRVCLRVSGMKTVPNEKPDDVLRKCVDSWEQCGIQVPDACIDRAHRIGRPYTDKTTKEEHQGVIIRFTTHRHRTLVYHNRRAIKTRVASVLGLT